MVDFWKPYDWRIKWWCRNVQNMQKIPIPWLKITAIQSRCWKGSSSDTKLFFFKFTLLSFMNPFCRIFLSLLILPWNHHQLKSDSWIFQFLLCLISITLLNNKDVLEENFKKCSKKTLTFKPNDQHWALLRIDIRLRQLCLFRPENNWKKRQDAILQLLSCKS